MRWVGSIGAAVLCLAVLFPESAAAKPKRKLLSITYNPILSNGQRLTSFMGWNEVPALRAQYLDILASKSGSELELVQAWVVNAFPRKADGFRYTEASYLECMSDASRCHHPDLADYRYILDAYDACELANEGRIDEVLIFGGPYFGFYESTLAGPAADAYWYNSPPVSGTACDSLLPVMGFSYHVGVDHMLHNLGHRTESTMRRVYGSWNHDLLRHNWDRFSLNPHDSPGYAYSGCGNVHYPPNTTTEYDYADRSARSSFCDEFYGYPAMDLSRRRELSCTAWGCSQLGYLSWWFDHIPANPATPPASASDRHSWSWWRYILDPNHILWEERGGRGKPRVPYAREYWVIDGRATVSEVQQIVALAYPGRITVGFSYDDAGIGDLEARKVVVWGDEHDRPALLDWYRTQYGGATVEFRALPGRGTWRFGPYATAPPAWGRGRPRVPYAREYWVVDGRASLALLQRIVAQGFPQRRTIGFSYDDAGIGDLDERTVVIWGSEHPESTLRVWYRTHYPGVELVFRALP